MMGLRHTATRTALYMLFFFFSSNLLQAQTVINGEIVYSDTNKKAEGVNVTLFETNGKTILAYTSTDSEGKYALSYGGQKDSLVVTITGFNVKKHSKRIVGKSQILNLEIESTEIRLNEVRIDAPKIQQRGDTINYRVSSFTDASDRTIADVLKKMPGIQVKESGQILYQDKPINKFYIENMDLLKGRYGIATNNVEAKDVSTVQVLENHQPIKALIGKEYVDEAAINLKLKDSAKGAFMASMQLGAGASPVLLSNELVGMRFDRRRQNMLMYKGDNSGRDISRELTSFYSNTADAGSAPKLLHVQSPSPPSITKQRHLFNDAHLGSINDLQKLAEDYTLTTNFDYLFDKQKKKSGSLNEYYLPGDSLLSILDLSNSSLYKNRMHISTQLEANKKEFFLNNEIGIVGEWDREAGRNLSVDTIHQYLKNPTYGVYNKFRLINRKKEKAIAFNSYISYRNLSQNLRVAPLIYSDLFDSEISGNYMRQKTKGGRFSSRNSVSWGTKKLVDMDFKFSFNADLQNLKSTFLGGDTPEVHTADSLKNNIRWNTFEWIFAPTIRYVFSRKLSVSANFPLKAMLLSRKDIQAAGSENSFFFHIAPSLGANFKFSPMLKGSLSYYYSTGVNDIQDAYTGYVMQSYRSISRNDGSINKRRQHLLYSYLNFKNPLTTLFASLIVNYSNRYSNLLNEYDYQGILRVKSSLKKGNRGEQFSASARIGKDISLFNSTIALGSSYRFMKSSQITQGEITDYESHYVSLSPSIVMRWGRWADLVYSFDWGISHSYIQKNSRDLPSIQTYSQKAKLNFYLLKGLVIGLSCENFYNNMVTSGSRSMWFGDLGVRYKWKDIDFSLDYTNVFNTDQYITASYTDIGRNVYAYNLHPSEILLRVRFKLK